MENESIKTVENITAAKSVKSVKIAENVEKVGNSKKARSKRKKHVNIADRIVSGCIVLSFIGVVCFAALLAVMLVMN